MKPVVQSLWVGNRLSRMEHYSIKSFLTLGYKFILYTYEPVANIPKGTTVLSGEEIIPKKDIFLLKKTYLPFADIFRYKMLYEKGGYWVDVDMIALKKFDFKEPYVFSSERTMLEGSLIFKDKRTQIANIGILKAPKGSPFYKELYERCMEIENKKNNKDKLRYMRALREMITKYGYEKYVKSPEYFCQLDWWYAKDAFIPNYTDKGNFKPKYGVHKPHGLSFSKIFDKPYTLHFWRDLVTKKYKLSLDAEYDDNSLWEILIKKIDSRKTKLKPKKGTRKVVRIKRATRT